MYQILPKEQNYKNDDHKFDLSLELSIRILALLLSLSVKYILKLSLSKEFQNGTKIDNNQCRTGGTTWAALPLFLPNLKYIVSDRAIL